jgi:3-oxoacyl-[acyl-carrier-protein] synthase-3
MTCGNEKSVGIVGIGSFVPEKILTNKDLEKMVDTTDEWISERTGIKERHIVDVGMNTSDIATAAAQRALKDAGLTADDIDLIVVATATPDMLFPSTACLVQNNLRACKAAAYDLAAGCSGFMYSIVTPASSSKPAFTSTCW